jgi:hypothetical protein
MVKRLFVAVLAAVASLAAIAGPASAAPPDTRVTVSGGSAGAAVSNCGSAPGTRCTTIFVSAGETTINDNGTQVQSETVRVDAFDTLVIGPGAVEGTSLGSAFTTNADVNIPASLRSASASVEDLAVGGLTLDIDVTWTGLGDLHRSRTLETLGEGGTTVRFGASRVADATAVVNGETFSEFEVFGNVSSLGWSKCRGDC